MPTAGSFIARIAEVAHSTTLSGTYTEVEKLKNPKLTGTQKTADSSSNDSGGYEENLPTWKTGQLTFDMVSDENAAGQEAIWDAWEDGTQLFYRLRPRGNNPGERQVRWQGTVTNIEETLSSEGIAMYAVTVQLTGAPTRDTQ